MLAFTLAPGAGPTGQAASLSSAWISRRSAGGLVQVLLVCSGMSVACLAHHVTGIFQNRAGNRWPTHGGRWKRFVNEKNISEVLAGLRETTRAAGHQGACASRNYDHPRWGAQEGAQEGQLSPGKGRSPGKDHLAGPVLLERRALWDAAPLCQSCPASDWLGPSWKPEGDGAG